MKIKLHHPCIYCHGTGLETYTDPSIGYQEEWFCPCCRGTKTSSLWDLWNESLMRDRSYLEEGTFGAIASHWCEHCGPVWQHPETVCTQKESWGFDGGEPAEWDFECPYCGRLESVSENEQDHGFKAKSRRTTQLRNPAQKGIANEAAA